MAGRWPWRGQAWTQGPGDPGGDPRNTGCWQAASRSAGPDKRIRAAGRPRVPGSGGAPRDAGSGRRPEPSRLRAGRRARGTPAVTPAPGKPLDPDQGYGGAQAQYGRGPGTRVPGRPPAARPGPGGSSQGQQPYPGQPHQGQPYQGQQHRRRARRMRNSGGFGRAGSPVIRQRDSALPDPAPGAKGPIAAIETDNIGAFARDLRVLRSKVGLDYPDMAEKSHYTMRTLASAAGGLRLPTLPVLIAYVIACGGDVGEWEERWGRLTRAGKKGQTALPAPRPGAGAASQDQGPRSGPGPDSAGRAADRRDLRHHLGQAARHHGNAAAGGGSSRRNYTDPVLPADNPSIPNGHTTRRRTRHGRSCEQAVAVGLPAIAFTEHLEFTAGGRGRRDRGRRDRSPLVGPDQAA